MFVKETDFTKPGPSQTFVLIDEHPDSIDDCLFEFGDAAAMIFGAPADGWVNVPASYHSDGCCLAFADCHVEYHKWTEKGFQKTIQPVTRNYPMIAVSKNDLKWLAFRATARIK